MNGVTVISGKRFRYVHPVHITEGGRVTFFPVAVEKPDSWGPRVARTRFSLRAQKIPTFTTLERFLRTVEQRYGKPLANLAGLGAVPVLKGPVPDRLDGPAKAELLDIARLDPASRLAYLKSERMYILIKDPAPLGASAVDSFYIFENAAELTRKLCPAPPPPPPGSVEHLLATLQLPKSSFVRSPGKESGEAAFRQSAFGIADPGARKGENEDVFVIDEGFLAVFDGMGAHQFGAETARAAALLTWQAVKDRNDTVAKAIEHASKIIHALGSEDHPVKKRGTTAVAARIDGDMAQIAHRGDSRAYIISKDGTIFLVTQDDSGRVSYLNACLQDQFKWPVENSTAFSYLKARFGSGLIFSLSGEDLVQFEAALEEFRIFLHDHPDANFPIDLRRNILHKAVGHTQGQPAMTEVQLKDGDLLLLCTDGLPLALKQMLYTILSAESQKSVRNIREIAQLLKREAIKAGAPDNLALVIYEHVPVASNQPAPPPPAHTITYELAQTAEPAALADLLDAIFSGNKDVPDALVIQVISHMGRIISENPDNPTLVSKAIDVISLMGGDAGV